MRKKIYIMTDLEGISGIVSESQVSDTKSDTYGFSLERLMRDVNAAIDGAFEGGASDVYVADGHGGGKNFIAGMLDKRAVQVCSAGDIDFTTIDGLMQIGAHAMAGTINGFLDHTQSSVSWHDYIVNGRKCGEIAQEGIFLGVYGAPCVMVSGDEAACVEAKQFFGDIECAVVKYGIGRSKARSVDLDEALLKIKSAAKNGMGLIGKIKPYKPLMPLEIIIEYNRADYLEYNVNRPDVERLDARTLRKMVYEIKNFVDILI